MQNYSKKLRLYNTKIVIKPLYGKFNHSIYVTNAPPEGNNTNPCGSYFLLFRIFFEIRTGWKATRNKRLYFTNEKNQKPCGERNVSFPAGLNR